MDFPQPRPDFRPGPTPATGSPDSQSPALACSDDRIIALMVWFYDITAPSGPE